MLYNSGLVSTSLKLRNLLKKTIIRVYKNSLGCETILDLWGLDKQGLIALKFVLKILLFNFFKNLYDAKFVCQILQSNSFNRQQ